MLANPPIGPRIRVDDLIGTRRVLTPGEEVTIGRAADFLVGDDDEFLHRTLLVLWFNGNAWMMRNIGSRLIVQIEPRGRDAFTQVSLGPGAEAPLLPGPSAVIFSTPDRTYELHIDVENAGNRAPGVRPGGIAAPATQGNWNPNSEQQELLALMAEPLARHHGVSDGELYSVKQLAQKLEWTEKKTNSKIERICASLANTGVVLDKPFAKSLARYAHANRHLFERRSRW